ncbi:MAG: hypothetical protein NTU45_02155, partial [Planctomycetota bacterium]|nr:hypothetical protein [Planctomycetota bacterium]
MASLTLAAAPMTAKLTLIAPEILLFIGSVVVAVLGLSRTPSIRRSGPFVTALFLVGSIAVTAFVYRSSAVAESGLLMPMLGGFAKALIASIAVFLV